MSPPDLARQLPGLERLRLVSSRPGRSLAPGRRRGLARGASVEFADYRRYNPGDDVRHIDWNIFARSRQLFLRQYRAETELEVHLLVDCSASMGVDASGKLDCAKRIASMLAFVGVENFDRVGLTTFSDSVVRHLPPERGHGRLRDLFEHLAATVAAGATDFAPAFESFGARARQGGLAIVVSDLLGRGPVGAGIDYLLYRKLEVELIEVLAAADVAPEIDGRAELRDAEDESLPPLWADEAAAERYREALAAHRRDLAAYCRRRGIRRFTALSSATDEELTAGLLAAGIWSRR